VSAAFSEDPLRVLRLARFAVRFPSFTVALETIALARTLASELNSLPAERIWQEISRGLMERAPERTCEVLIACNAWEEIFPEIQLIPTAQKRHFWQGDLLNFALLSLPERYAVLTHAATSDHIYARSKVPVDCSDLARLCVRLRTPIAQFGHRAPTQKFETPMQGDALRRADRLRSAVRVIEYLDAAPNAYAPNIDAGIAALTRVDAGAIARAVPATELPGD
jgi:tRNA nucleotidyltransferase (CCA-adding enzyme)